jgi:hypothetical protein
VNFLRKTYEMKVLGVFHLGMNVSETRWLPFLREWTSAKLAGLRSCENGPQRNSLASVPVRMDLSETRWPPILMEQTQKSFCGLHSRKSTLK